MARSRSLLLLFSVAGLIGVLKGLPYAIPDGNEFYWLFNYEQGFLRRALVGTIFHPVLADQSLDQLRRTVLALHTGVCIVIVCALAALFWRVVRHATSAEARVTTAFAFLCLMSAQFMPMLAHEAGTMDVYIVLTVLAGFLLVTAERYVAAALTFLVGPLIHEAFIFAWAPVGLVMLWSLVWDHRARARKLLPLTLPILATAIVVLFHDTGREQEAIAALPLATQVKSGLADHTFQQTAATAFQHMREHELPNNLGKAFGTAVFFLIPSAGILWAAAFAFRDRWSAPAWTFAFMIIATLSPLAILALAWDLTRFLAWSNLAAGLVLIASGTPGLFATAEPRA